MTRLALIVVGDEILAGRRRDHDGAWIARRCAEEGVGLGAWRVLPDALAPLTEGIAAAAAQADLLVLSGGLGPTVDDRTRDALAAAAGVSLQEDATALGWIRAALGRRGREPSTAERRQALVPAGGRALGNPVGIAPGLCVPVGACTAYALPGVPRECEAVFDAHVAPVLAACPDASPPPQGVVWVAGLPESAVAARLADVAPLAAVDVAYYPHDGEVEVRLGGAADDVARALEAARERLGPAVFHPPAGGRLEHAVVAALRRRGWRVATAESVTGGLIAHMLTRVPGASAVFPVGWVTYATAQKTACLGVDAALIAREGVVSAAVAQAMAEGARARAGTEAALATTGSAGPGALEEAGRAPVPPGRVFVALARADGPTEVRDLALGATRALVQRVAAVTALDMLRRALA